MNSYASYNPHKNPFINPPPPPLKKENLIGKGGKLKVLYNGSLNHEKAC